MKMKLGAMLISLIAGSAFAQFSHESELGIVSTKGNTEIETYNVKTTNKYLFGGWDTSLGAHYTLGTQVEAATGEEIEAARNWDVNARVGHKISGNLSGFLAHKIEGDKFAGFTERNNSDIGLSYSFFRTDTHYWIADIGYRRQITTAVGGPADATDRARLYTETENKVNANLTYKFWLELLPAINDAEKNGNQFNFEPSIAATLSDIFSLKLSYKGMYNSVPVGTASEYYDSVFTTSLLAKF